MDNQLICGDSVFCLLFHSPVYPGTLRFGDSCCRLEVVLSRRFWSLPGPFAGMELCISVSGKKLAEEDLPMGNSSSFMTSPPPCMHRCFLPGPTPFTGAHWPQTDRKWLAVEQRGVGVSLGAILVGTWASAGRCRPTRPSLAMMVTSAPRFRVAKD